MNRRTSNNYTAEKVSAFLTTVKRAVEMGDKSKMTLAQILRFYKFGSISIKALKLCGFVRVDGRGFASWTWIPTAPVNDADVAAFICAVDRVKDEHGKKYRPEKTVEAPQPTNVVSFKPSEPKKAVQAELPIHPVRLAVLNGIRTELNEIRLQLEKIEDRIDQETTKKAAGR